MLENLKIEITNLLKSHYPACSIIVQEPKDFLMGDVAIPLFSIVKTTKETFDDSYMNIKKILLNEFSEDIIQVELVDGFINLSVNKKKVALSVLNNILLLKNKYGTSKIGNKKTMVIDFSSPNIAKPFSIGHLRSTIIGEALSNLNEKCGFKVVRINHLGDWGTQFGKLIVAYEKWGDEKKVRNDPINELLALYVRFNEEAQNDERLQNEARIAFNKLETGDVNYLKLWEWFKVESLKEFREMYELLNVSFDSYAGESFYNDKLVDVAKELENKHLLVESEGAIIVPLENMTPALIKKSDGSTLYMTRELAAVFYRKNTYHFNKMLYVVGNEQTLHFKQLKAIIYKMGYDFGCEIEHINFGLVLQNGKKMSTRKGKTVKLKSVLDEAIKIAETTIEKKNPSLMNKSNIAQKIGVNAIIFNDLKNHRLHDIEFNIEQMLQFEGQTGPYLQYTSVRINSILCQCTMNLTDLDESLIVKNHYFNLIRSLDKFQSIIEKSVIEEAPSILAQYALSLASLFNTFYSLERIIVDNNLVRETNLKIAYCVKIVLDESMRLLGMQMVEEM